MSFEAPELLTKGNPKTCAKCGKHVNNTRVISWDFGFCPKCYELELIRKHSDFNPLDTVVKSSRINPVTMYLNLYTKYDMRGMK